MGGGLIQLVAKGTQDIFLVKDPQITFFKVVYRRHTNFSTEPIKLPFHHRPNFGTKGTCTITRAGDLVHKIHLVVTLPKVPLITVDGEIDPIKKFRWAKKIGFVLIKKVELEIGGQVIDTQYGDWMNIWNEMTGTKDEGFNKMIGDVKILTDFTNGKEEYQLYIPLQFWFTKSIGLSLPLVALQYSEVKVNVEFNDRDKCYTIGPTNSILMDNDFVNYDNFEFISQTVSSGNTVNGIYMGFDDTTKKLYYQKIETDKSFVGTITTNTVLNNSDRLTVIRATENDKYKIVGRNSKYEAMPKINASESTESLATFRNLNLKNVFLLVDYIFLDDEERIRMAKAHHEYIIEQVQYDGERTIEARNRDVRLASLNPCKELYFVLNLKYFIGTNLNDHFNYSNTFDPMSPNVLGKSIIEEAVLILNGKERVSLRDIDYYNNLVPYYVHSNGPSIGINVLSFGLTPETIQPSGTCNMSAIDHIILRIKTYSGISFTNIAKMRVYMTNYNVLRIVHGLSGLVFTDQQ